MSEESSETKIVLIVNAKSWHGPRDAIEMIKRHLDFPAIKKVTIVSAETNYVLHGEPSKEFKKVLLDHIDDPNQGIF